MQTLSFHSCCDFLIYCYCEGLQRTNHFEVSHRLMKKFNEEKKNIRVCNGNVIQGK